MRKRRSNTIGFQIEETSDGVIFNVRVQPRASRNAISGLHGSALKIRLTSPPLKGRANRLCTKFLADELGISTSKITIISGEKSRDKRIRVDGVKKEDILKLI